MKLKTISARHFKGLSFDEVLGDASIFIGSNFKGKTARLDAVRLLLLGYLPELGKTARATFALASGPEMVVSGELEDGRGISRRFYLEGNTVRCDNDVPEEIDQYEQMAVMMSADEYFALSDRDRVTYVAEHCPAQSDLSRAGVCKRVREWLTTGEAKIADRVMKVIAEAPDPDSSVQSYVEHAIEAVADAWKAVKAYAVQMEKTIQGLSQLRAQDAPATAGVEDARARLTREVAGLIEKRGRLMAAFTQMKSDHQRRGDIDRELRFADKNRTELASHKEKLEIVEAGLRSMPTIGQTSIIDAAEVAAVGKSELQANAKRIEDTRDKIHQAETELEALGSQKRCPYCGAAGENWKALRAAEYETQIATLKTKVDELRRSERQLTTVLEASRAHMEQLRADATRRQAFVDRQENLTRAIAVLEPQISRLDTLKQELGRLSVMDPALTTEVETIQSDINVKNEQLRGYDLAIKAAMGRAHELQRLADAETQRDEAKVEQEMLAAAGKELRAIQGEIVQAAFDPLLKCANSFFGEVLLTPLAYHQGEIGTWRGGSWVGHHTFSGTEKALCYAAIQAALAADAPVRVILIDELGRLDTTTLGKVMSAVRRLSTEGIQFIGIDAGRSKVYRALDGAEFALIVREIS